MKQYTYVSVIYDDDIIAKTTNEPSLYYLTDLEEIFIDDKVLVNRNGKDVVGIVVNIEEFDEDKVPYPVEKTKNIIKVVESSFVPIDIECPNCGEKMIEILYGMPDAKVGRLAEKGKLFLGGCILDDNKPEYHCNTCRRSYYKDLETYIEEPNNWDDEEQEEREKIECNKISKEDFLKIDEKDVMFITNPGRMGDEDGTTFIVKKDMTFTIYRVDGWIYLKGKPRVDISLHDVEKQFPKWLDAWKHGDEDNYKGKYKYIYMGFGNGLSVDNSIYSEFEPYLNELVEEYLMGCCKEEKESYKFAAIFNVWGEAFIKMAKEKEFILK